MVKGLRNILLFAIVALLASCGPVQDTYTSHSCYFLFNTTYHPSTMLKASVKGYNGFCLVYKGASGGQQKVFVEKFGETDPTSPYAYTNVGEPKVTDLVIGTDNGLLLGYSPLDLVIVAYDRHCPKCSISTKGRVEWNNSISSVKCPNCGTVYDLTVTNNGLDRYPASYDGTFIRVVKN